MHDYYAEVLVNLGIVGLSILVAQMVVDFTFLRKIENFQFTSRNSSNLMTRAYKHQFRNAPFRSSLGNPRFLVNGTWFFVQL